MSAYFATSASPERKSRSGSVASVSTSASTARGCENVPTRFLPSGRLTAVLPPIAASTCARQRRRHLDERHAAHVRRGDEPGEIADRSAAQRDDQVVPMRLLGRELMQQGLVDLQRLGRLALGHGQRHACQPRARRARTRAARTTGRPPSDRPRRRPVAAPGSPGGRDAIDADRCPSRRTTSYGRPGIGTVTRTNGAPPRSRRRPHRACPLPSTT